MGLLSPVYLTDTVGVDPLVMESSEALRILAEANRYIELRGAERGAAESDGGCASASTLLSGSSWWWWADLTAALT